MSNALAIGAVTAVLRDLLNNGLIQQDVGSDLRNEVVVTVLPPDVVAEDREIKDKDLLNLFLYRVTPNAGWRNVGLPSRDGNGTQISNPPLALDLHYLLTAYSQKSFHAEILLGYAMQLLHETPVLTRAAIRRALEPPSSSNDSVVSGSLLPLAFRNLSAASIADQIEQIKICHEATSLEELSKLWTAFQTHYRPTALYQVSVVLIESQKPVRSPLPVLTRGSRDPNTGRETGVIVQPSLIPAVPTLEMVSPPRQQLAVRMGEELTLRGHHLENVREIQFTHLRSARSLVLPVASEVTSTQVQVRIPVDLLTSPQTEDESPTNPDNWQIGVYSVAGVVRQSDGSQSTTNELSVALAPKIDPSAASRRVTRVGVEVTIALTCRPKVWKTQQVQLALSDRVRPAEPITEAKTDSLTFKFTGLSNGNYWMRLRVDGVESLLIDCESAPPDYYSSERLTIP